MQKNLELTWAQYTAGGWLAADVGAEGEGRGEEASPRDTEGQQGTERTHPTKRALF